MFLAKSLVTGGAKLAAMGIGKLIAEEGAEVAGEALAKGTAEVSDKEVVDAIKNVPTHFAEEGAGKEVAETLKEPGVE